ncbi:MAG: 50S ribosomal protein L1 [Planctomycetes bacterium]|nr:50S ribosomal protein L1 [Planctomycetota bacterium]
MKSKSKRYKNGIEALDVSVAYPLSDAVKLLKSFPAAKFDETVEIAMKLSIDPKKAEQAVRGAFSTPHGFGKTIRVIAFVDEANVEKAKKAGAIEAGGNDLADKIKNEQWFDFDVAIAEPKMMKVVGLLGRVLGPKGLMPSPKAGTVVPDPIKAIEEFASGKQEYRNDAGSNIHYKIGKLSFENIKLEENIKAFVNQIVSVRPASVKGNYISKVTISSTMGPGIKIQL